LQDSANQSERQHDRAIDEIITTLRNMDNVHSIRGESDEAMRYFTEVTNSDHPSVMSGNGGVG
jgi:hypothetical protein